MLREKERLAASEMDSDYFRGLNYLINEQPDKAIDVFVRMLEEMLFLANQGAEILRLDAVAYVWKRLGTNCQNLPEAHWLIQAFTAAATGARIALRPRNKVTSAPSRACTRNVTGLPGVGLPSSSSQGWKGATA